MIGTLANLMILADISRSYRGGMTSPGSSASSGRGVDDGERWSMIRMVCLVTIMALCEELEVMLKWTVGEDIGGI